MDSSRAEHRMRCLKERSVTNPEIAACQPRIEIDSGAGLAVFWWEQADLNC
jgi:hypothetical protein